MRVEGAPYPLGMPPLPRGHLVCPPDSVFLHDTLLVGKNSLYNLLKVLTTVPRKYPLSLFRVVSVADLEQDVFSRVSRGESGVSPDTRSRRK